MDYLQNMFSKTSRLKTLCEGKILSYITQRKTSSRKTIYDANILEQHFEERATKLYYFLGSVSQ